MFIDRLFCLVRSSITIAFRSCLISSIHVRCGLLLGRLTFLRYSASASLAGVSGWSIMRWPSQLMRLLCIVMLHSSVLVLMYISMLVIFLGQCMPRIFLRCLLWKVLTVFSKKNWRESTVRCCRGIHLLHMHWRFWFWLRCWFFCCQKFYSAFWKHNIILQE